MLRRIPILRCVKKPVFKKSAYETLGIHRTSSPDDVKLAYQKLIAIHHPDKGGDADEFMKIKQAYEEIMAGAPLHMIYQERDPADILKDGVKQKTDKFFKTKLGIGIKWENIRNEYSYVSTEGRFLAVMTVIWVFYFCKPARPILLLWLAIAWFAELLTGLPFVVLGYIYIMWYSLKERWVPGFFTTAGSYWAIDRPNTMTLGLGIPNYQRREVYSEGKSKSSYSNLLGKTEKKEGDLAAPQIDK